MNTQQFAQSIRQKYPTGITSDGKKYSDLSDQELTEKVVSKYPTYQSQISDFQPRGVISKSFDAIKNFTGDVAKDAASIVTTPVSRATEAVTRTLAPNSMAAKGYEAFTDENQPVETGVFGIQAPQPGNTLEQGARTITGETAHTAAYLLPYGKVAGALTPVVGKTLGNVAAGAVGGYLSDIGSNLPDQNQTIGQALTPGLGTAIGAAIPGVPAVLQGTGRLTKKLGEKTVDAVIPVSMREAGILQAYKADTPFLQRIGNVLKATENSPQIAGKTATEQGLMGTKSLIGVQAKRAADTLYTDVIGPRLKASPYKVDLPKYFDVIQENIIKDNPELGRQQSLLEALDSVRETYKNTPQITLDELQKLKEGWAQFVPQKAYQGKDIAGAANEVNNLLADEARQTIYNQLGNDVKQAYFDYGNLKGLQEMGKVSMTGQKLKGGSGSFISEILSQAVTPVATIGGQVVYKIGQGLEFIGNVGAKTVDEALGLTNKKKVSQDLSTPINQESSQIPINQSKNVIMESGIPQSVKNTSGKMSGFANITKNIPKELQSLAEEAKKYKSAEEFINKLKSNDYTEIFHGTDKKGGDVLAKDFTKYDRKMLGKNTGQGDYFGAGISFTDDINTAKGYGKEVIPAYYNYMDNEILNLNAGDFSKQLKKYGIDENSKNASELLTKELEKEGYKGMTIYDGIRGQTETTIFDPSILKTKQQLIDLYNKVHGKQSGFADLGMLPKMAGTTAIGVGAIKAAQNIPGSSELVTTQPGDNQISNNVDIKNKQRQQDINSILEGISKRETGIVKNPYSYRRFSGDPNLGDALGKWQVTEGTLKTYSPKYLGRQVTPEEFLSSPELQDKWQTTRAIMLLDAGFEPDEIIQMNFTGSLGSQKSGKNYMKK